jgi:hypothetical protein
MGTKDFYTVEEMAALLRVQASAIRNRLSKQDTTLPPSMRVGGRRLFPALGYEAWKAQLMAPYAPPPTSAPLLRPGRPRQGPRGLA